jgi:hypothetical protein
MAHAAIHNARIIWAAGFFDGEGCVQIKLRKTPTPCHFVRLSVNQVNPEPLLILKQLFGGTISFHSKSGVNDRSRDIWSWQIGSQKAVDALKLMHPYLIVKAGESDIAIKFQSTVCYRGKEIPEEIVERRLQLVKDITTMKYQTYSSPEREVA